MKMTPKQIRSSLRKEAQAINERNRVPGDPHYKEPRSTMTTPSTQERQSKQFWAVDDTWEVVFVTGYECPPNDDVWWVPELGYSLSEKHHLFATAQDAREHAMDKLESNIADLQRALDRLRKESADAS